VNDKAKAKAIAEMVDRRKAAIRQKMWNEVALQLLAERGTLAVEDVDEIVNATIAEISDQALADQIAAKTASAVDYHQREVAMAQLAIDGARAKVEKFEGLIANARADLDNLQVELEATKNRLSDAEELAEYAAQQGDASAAPAPTNAAVQADTAHGEGGTH
jgi:hypothetical protein